MKLSLPNKVCKKEKKGLGVNGVAIGIYRNAVSYICLTA